jgi:hypothetical protein
MSFNWKTILLIVIVVIVYDAFASKYVKKITFSNKVTNKSAATE